MAESEKKTVKPFICPCGRPACGVGKTHQQIGRNWSIWAAHQGLAPGQIEAVDRKMRSLGKLVAAGRL